MTFHIVGLPSAQTNSQSSCPFTSLTANFIKMMKSLGHNVTHYGVGCDVDCENVDVMEPVSMDWTGQASWWATYNQRIIDAINKRKQPRDFVCIINGWLNRPLEQISDVMLVEYAVGYTGCFSKYRVFASYAHRNKVYGYEGGFDPDGKFYDTVVPHYLDPTEYPLKKKTGDYYLYVGRLTHRKGVQIAVDVCEHLDVKLKIAGTGEETYQGKNVELLGLVTGKQKVELYQNAIATFCPTLYLEPFGMSAIESQMCGTPVISTDFGAYPETVEHGKTGFRCNTLSEFVCAAKEVKKLNPQHIRDRAIQLYSVENIRYQYNTYFNRLLDLWKETGWNTLHK